VESTHARKFARGVAGIHNDDSCSPPDVFSPRSCCQPGPRAPAARTSSAGRTTNHSLLLLLALALAPALAYRCVGPGSALPHSLCFFEKR
jgi:hypothetical protein